MRVRAGGEDGHGVYTGEVLPEPVARPRRLIRVDGIVRYPSQRALMARGIYERLPLPYGSVVRMRVCAPTDAPAARDAAEYGEMVERALQARLEESRRDDEREILRDRAGKYLTGVDKSYCTK